MGGRLVMGLAIMVATGCAATMSQGGGGGAAPTPTPSAKSSPGAEGSGSVNDTTRPEGGYHAP